MLAFPQPLPASRLYLPQTHPSEHQQVGGKLDCLLLHLERGSFYLFKEQTARSGSSAQRLSSLTSLLSKHFPIFSSSTLVQGFREACKSHKLPSWTNIAVSGLGKDSILCHGGLDSWGDFWGTQCLDDDCSLVYCYLRVLTSFIPQCFMVFCVFPLYSSRIQN